MTNKKQKKKNSTKKKGSKELPVLLTTLAYRHQLIPEFSIVYDRKNYLGNNRDIKKLHNIVYRLEPKNEMILREI